MPIIGSLIKSAIELRSKMPAENRQGNPVAAQKKVLRRLIRKAQLTSFGEHYGFSEILKSKNTIEDFRNNVPLHDYNKMHNDWWYRALSGEAYVSWPGRVKYFALSSGTSEASSKYIPVTADMIRAIKKISVRQLVSLARYDIPKDFFKRGILMLGGSTHLNYNGTYYEGDLSGITTGNIPFWFQHHYKPGKRISKERDWETKLEEIIKKAPEWDIGAIVGVPAWFQILLKKIIDRYDLEHIHEIWPNLHIFTHGGVSFAPYISSFEKLVGREMIYMETYLASEGFIAYQNRPGTKSMSLVCDNGIFYEFVPFNDDNFDFEGNLKPDAKTLTLGEVEIDKEYALLLSTNAGAWRYLIGDVVRFTSLNPPEILIVGRTKHYLSICGEHLSQENMNRAIEMYEQDNNVSIPEFTVAGLPYENMFQHKWWIGSSDHIDPMHLSSEIDKYLKKLNDDYRVERIAAIRKVEAEVLPVDMFYDFLKSQGKVGAQIKFPRVMKKHLPDWLKYLESVQKST
ncbi:MAG: GH3 auxin-responsive promoter [Marinilabiliales bacterium]|nr:MAG: GH3 auxin-responsive promoter [Marinilabiliales bacterium]